MSRPKKFKLGWWLAGALAAAIVWGAGPARADDEIVVPDAAGPNIAPALPSADDRYLDLRDKLLFGDEESQGGRLGVGERLRDHGYSTRKDLIRKTTLRDVVDRSKRGGKPPQTIDPPFETQPISIGYGRGNPPQDVPEPTAFALMSVGLASWILFSRRRRP